jgi:tetratricopeptide (TPR) repeat protein
MVRARHTVEPAEAVGVELREIRRLLAVQRIEEACQRCDALEGRAPNDIRTWILGAEISLRLRKLAEGTEKLRSALACKPTDPADVIRVGQYFHKLGRHRESILAAKQAAGLGVTRPEQQDALGTLFTHNGEANRAVPFFSNAVEAAPGNPHFRYNLAMAQRMTGDFLAAERNLDQVIDARPDDGEAHYARSGLRMQTPDLNHVAQLEAALERQAGRRSGIAIGFALAKELEDLGEYSRSFANLAQACGRHRASLDYDVSTDLAVLDALRHCHTTKSLRHSGLEIESEQCIFVIGLPRTGTTLIERIVGAHPLVHAAGEIDAFPSVAIEGVTRAAEGAVGKLSFVQQSLSLDLEALGRAYLMEARPQTSCAARFTDKLPINYLYAGLIHAALPRAKFLLVRRNPMDSCYAMYKTLFASAYPFSYDLTDLVKYYVSWDKLMRHWREVIGSAWLEVEYEDVVADQEQVSRQLISHCGLEWDNRCLDFHSNEKVVTTASAAQVRKPVYADSVGRWRRYASQLEPLARALEANGIVIQ